MKLVFDYLIPFTAISLVPIEVEAQGGNAPISNIVNERHNILWIFLDDVSPWMSCYNDMVVVTPNIDQLASNGVRFDRAYMTSAVSSPSRSAIITGMYQTSIGAHHHRSSREVLKENKIEILDPNYLGVKTLPEIFKNIGYYTFNEGKTDYNFVFSDENLYDRSGEKMGFQGAVNGSEWSGCHVDQPFFGQIQLTGSNPPKIIIPENVVAPPYYPDHPVYLEEIAHHYNQILYIDKIVGDIISKLKSDGLYENTVIFLFSDQGMRLPRHKQFLYEGGIRVPLIVSGPGIPVNQVRNDLVSGIDISASTLSLAGIEIPDHIQGMNFFTKDFKRDYTISARDRCDYTIDRIRTVVTERYKYIRNFMTDKPYLQAQYRDGSPFMELLRNMYNEGCLNEFQKPFASEYRPAEEFYDLFEDPYEVNNLIYSVDPEHAVELAKHRDILYEWVLKSDDKGRYPETDNGLKAVIDRWGEKAGSKEFKRILE